MAKKGIETGKSRLTDPNHVTEVFADEIVSAHLVDGIVIVTFAMGRITSAGAGKEREAARERQISCRLAITQSALADLHTQLTTLANTAALLDPNSTPGNKPN